MMKKMIALAMCMMMVCGVTACGTGNTGSSQTTAATEMAASAQIPNPFVDCETMEAAQKTAGFDMTVPEKIEGYPDRLIQAIADEMIQVFYQKDEEEVLIRKGAGSDDISGDYEVYDATQAETVDGMTVTFKSNGDNIYVATWVSGDYTYSIRATAGMNSDAMKALVSEVK